VVQRVPFPEEIRLLDDRVDLVFYSIQLGFHERPVVLGSHPRDLVVDLVLFFLELVEFVAFFQFLDPQMEHHRRFHCRLGGPDAEVDDRVLRVHGMDEAPLGGREFLRDRPRFLVSRQVVELFPALGEAPGVGGPLEALFLEGFDGVFHQRDVGRGVAALIGVGVDVWCLVMDLQPDLLRGLHRITL